VERAATQTLLGQVSKATLKQIEPGAGREIKVPAKVAGTR
jgi:hypothetical protein